MSETRTISKAYIQESRAHDYLYDPLFALSSERDHVRATFKANTGISRMRRLPEFKAMFSSLQHYPNSQVQIDSTDPVPSFVSRHWRGYREEARENLIRYKKFNYDPDVVIPIRQIPKEDVLGRDRYKYFKRPILPFLHQQLPDAYKQCKSDMVNEMKTMVANSSTNQLTRSVAIQTDYRESDTQTDPYSPEYVIRPGSHPELLTLATLCYEHGLPAGLAEVEIIERARAKRAWESTLPPLSNTEMYEERRKMMADHEAKEWAFRESQIEKLQQAKLQVFQRLLKDKENKNNDLKSKYLGRLRMKKLQEKEAKVKKIRAEHIKMLRKLNHKHENVEGKLERRDILKDYSDPGSEVYAPLSRNGVFLDKGSEHFKVNSSYLSTYQGLLELEESLPDCLMNPKIEVPKLSSARGSTMNRNYRRQVELDVIAKESKTVKEEKEAKPLRFVVKIEKPIPRPPTPTVITPNLEEEDKELAIIFLQKIIRGRAIQNMMFAEKERRKELINELRSTHALQKEQMKQRNHEKSMMLSKQHHQKLNEEQELIVNEYLDRIEGECLGELLNFLSKELIRFQEERRIHAFAMIAERQRRLREAEESGKRQLEERRRREEDEIFRQVIGVHQETVDSYLSNIITNAISATAEEQSKQEVEAMAVKINQVAYEMEASRSKLQSEEIVAELVTSFLLPEVERIHMRESIKNKQRSGLLAAHRVIFNESSVFDNNEYNNN
ncbi:cilia- and flagella-associated protein 91 isoform X1 [Hydra vulgaris]|uniref:cilia- and flagella-associated protein 91 isoform X1 n=2 Tax=Hydra vulgaris TaxID=6087 RepID=UPI001F5F8908|nr:cilia- and flagella-associated protein 91 isoform X1 [Hydra vulgaris]